MVGQQVDGPPPRFDHGQPHRFTAFDAGHFDRGLKPGTGRRWPWRVQHVAPNSQQEARRLSERPRPSESICHIPDTIGIPSRRGDATESKAEIPRRLAERCGYRRWVANKFHWMVLKMRQALTFLATFETDHPTHENVGRYFDPGAAHHIGRRLYRPVADKRATGGPTRALTLALGAGVGLEPLGDDKMLSVDQFLRLVSVPAVFLAFHIATQISGG
jgi:hypothetical protein